MKEKKNLNLNERRSLASFQRFISGMKYWNKNFAASSTKWPVVNPCQYVYVCTYTDHIFLTIRYVEPNGTSVEYNNGLAHKSTAYQVDMENKTRARISS